MSEIDRQMREQLRDFIFKFEEYFDDDIETMIEYIREVILEEA